MEPGHEGIQFFIDGKAKVIMGHGKRTYAFKWVLSEVDPAAGVDPCPRGLEGRKGVLCEIPGPRGKGPGGAPDLLDSRAISCPETVSSLTAYSFRCSNN